MWRYKDKFPRIVLNHMKEDDYYISDCCGANVIKDDSYCEEAIKRAGNVLYKGTCSKCEEVAYFYHKHVDYETWSIYKELKHNDIINKGE